MLEKIILLIKESSSYDELVINPFSKMYGFEILRYDMPGYYSFNLCKNGGMIRLICRIEKEKNIRKVLLFIVWLKITIFDMIVKYINNIIYCYKKNRCIVINVFFCYNFLNREKVSDEIRL